MNFEIVTPPEDYNHPVSEQDEPRFEKGHEVKFRDGRIGVIDDVLDHYMNRAGQKVYRRHYVVEIEGYRSDYVTAFGYELSPLDQELHDLKENYRQLLLAMERKYNEEQLHLYQQFVTEVADYERHKTMTNKDKLNGQ